MKTMVVGASKGLGKALIEGLGEPGDTLIGVSRSHPGHLQQQAGVQVRWVEANLAEPAKAAQVIEDPLSTPRAVAEQRGEGHSIPVHDVVQVVRMTLSLSSASFVKDITLPAILDERF